MGSEMCIRDSQNNLDSLQIFRPELTHNNQDSLQIFRPELTQNNLDSLQIFRPELTQNNQDSLQIFRPELTHNNLDSLQIFRPELTQNNLDSLQIFRGAWPSEEAGERDGGGGDRGVDVEVKGHHDLGDRALRVAIHGALPCGTPLVGHQHHVAVLSELDVDGQGSH